MSLRGFFRDWADDKGWELDAAAEGGTVVSLPAGLLPGEGAGCLPIPECGVLPAEDP
jgi:hypothetical protein